MPPTFNWHRKSFPLTYSGQSCGRVICVSLQRKLTECAITYVALESVIVQKNRHLNMLQFHTYYTYEPSDDMSFSMSCFACSGGNKQILSMNSDSANWRVSNCYECDLKGQPILLFRSPQIPQRQACWMACKSVQAQTAAQIINKIHEIPHFNCRHIIESLMHKKRLVFNKLQA